MYFCKVSDVEIDDDCSIYNLIENPRTFIVKLFPYYAGNHKGNICKYARGKDYHIVVREKLDEIIQKLKPQYKEAKFVAMCDDVNIPEVQIAYKSGAGILGKNNLIFDPEYGGYVFIGIIATDVDIEFVPIEEKICVGCNACIKNCPTKALSEQGVNQDKCLSHITQKNGEITDEETKSIKNAEFIWGCDRCLDVCPMNVGIRHTFIREFKEDLIYNINIREVENLTRKQFKSKFKDRAFTFRGPRPIHRNLTINWKSLLF